jgi:hypothetical protein
MKQLVLLFSLCTLLAVQANAQKGGNPANYETAIGARVNPWLIGFTVKHFVKGPHAFEGLVVHNLDNRKNVTFTFLYEYHWNVFGIREFNMYAGGGAHLGIYDRRDYDWDRYVRHGDGTYVAPGLDGIFGLEYKFKKIPLVVSADVKPYFHFTGGNDFIGEEIGGASVRYTFGGRR